MKKYIALITIFSLVGLVGYSLAGYSLVNADDTSSAPAAAEKSTAKVVKKSAQKDYRHPDIVMGDPNAPVTIIEYASFTCPHCASFHAQVLPLVKESYIDTGKAKFIFRDFPLDRKALMASVTTRCVPEANFYKVVSFLFSKQMTWAQEENPAAWMRQVALANGADGEEFEACFNNEAVIKGVAQNRLLGSQEHKITSTPSFVVNGKVVSGGRDFKYFRQIIDEALAGSTQASKN